MAGEYYIYEYVHPTTREILYVGKGQRGRAWDYPPPDQTPANKARGPELAVALAELTALGYTPEDWVRVRLTNLSRDAALTLERILILERATPFNKRGRPKPANDNDPSQLELAV